MDVLIIIIVLIFLYWFVILRPGRLDFWKMASKYPDDVYDFFISRGCWKIFEDGLPDDYRSIVPKKEWDGPFRIIIPKIGNKMIYVFGKYPEFELAQNEFMNTIKTTK